MKFPLLSRVKQLTRRQKWLCIAVLLLLVCAVLIGLKRSPKTEAASAQAKVPAALEFQPADVTQVRLGDLRRTLPLSGSLRAVNQVPVKAKVSAEVREVLVREGETVKAGQVLIRMDASEYQAKLDQARGAWQAAQGQLDIATQTRNNNKALLEKNFISKNAFDNAQSQYQIAVSNVKSAKGAFDVAKKALDDTVIRAPISGQISIRAVQPGEKVATDNKLLEIVDLRQMEMEAAVPAADIVNVAVGQEMQLRIEGVPDMIIGKVVRINPSIQTGSRSILAYIQIDNPQGTLKMGMFAEGKLTLTKRSGVLSVPETSVQTEAGKPIVYAIENGRLAQKEVTVGISGDDGEGNAVEIVSGLEKDAQVVKVNLGNLLGGTPVRFAKSVEPAPAASTAGSSAASSATGK
ncbi:MAG: efflux transporter periplasmic adaptor subunit [Burkholderiaceae bacterium]|nr:efflux transporter periplasmic adaptor subunit [Burkholderiaceae bacterium]